MSTQILPEFDLLVPHTVNEAVKILAKHKNQAAILAGGTDLLVLMKDGYRVDYVISLAEISGLNSLKYGPKQGLQLGAMVTMADVVEARVVKENYPALWKSASENGSPQTRTMGTVVGNILRASPSGDCCCAVLALGGSVILRGPKGTREVPIDEFWLDYRVTARKPDELALALKLPPMPKGTVSAFAKLTRTTLDRAKVNAAVRLDMSQGKCTQARIAVGAVAPTTIRLPKTEKLVAGQAITEQVLQEVQQSVSTEIKPIDDVRSTAEYRRDVTGVLVKRVIEQALGGI
jgi:carbon-monoxide dehydrogenase medium subunit